MRDSGDATKCASARRAEGLARYRRDCEAGRVGRQVHSRSGRDLPAHRPRVEVDEATLIALHNAGLSLRAIAKAVGVGLGTVTRAFQRRSNTFPDGSCCKEPMC